MRRRFWVRRAVALFVLTGFLGLVVYTVGLLSRSDEKIDPARSVSSRNEIIVPIEDLPTPVPSPSPSLTPAPVGGGGGSGVTSASAPSEDEEPSAPVATPEETRIHDDDGGVVTVIHGDYDRDDRPERRDGRRRRR